jgi:hypothetical protein
MPAKLRAVPRPSALLALAAAALLGAAAARAGDAPAADHPEPAKPKAARSASTDGAPGPPTWYAQALAHGAGGLNVTHFWSKGPWLRAETVIAGHKVVNIVKGPWYYAYDGLTKRGLAIRRDPKAEAKDAPDRRPFGREFEILQRQGAELVREEELMGRKTAVYRITDLLGRRELTVTEDEKRLPLRIEIYERQTSKRRITDYVNWESSLPIPDGFFEPEPDVKIERLELEQYIKRTLEEGPVGAVPVLYADLLHAKHDE